MCNRFAPPKVLISKELAADHCLPRTIRSFPRVAVELPFKRSSPQPRRGGAVPVSRRFGLADAPLPSTGSWDVGNHTRLTW